jgi:hypothetical protein
MRAAMITSRSSPSGHNRQRGVGTLAIALILLLGVTVTLLFTANIATMEQRMSGNELRAKQAAAAAQAGVEHALAGLGQPGTPLTQTFAPDTDLRSGSTYRTVLWAWDTADPGNTGPDADNACPDVPGLPLGYSAAVVPQQAGSFLILSCAWSDDRAARSMAVMAVAQTPALTDAAKAAPLISKSYVDTFGAGRVFNFFTNLTIWAGGPLDVTGNAGTTFIRNPDFVPASGNADDYYDELPNRCDSTGAVSATDPYICTTRGGAQGPDVIQSDLSLETITEAGFFEAFTGQTKESYEENFAYVWPPDRNLEELATLDDSDSRIIWINGDVSLPSGITIGSSQDPLILIIAGNLTVTGNTKFYGTLYVEGTLTTNGTPEFYGVAIVEGEVDTVGGTPSFIYDNLAVTTTQQMTLTGRVAGSWRDWLRPAQAGAGGEDDAGEGEGGGGDEEATG